MCALSLLNIEWYRHKKVFEIVLDAMCCVMSADNDMSKKEIDAIYRELQNMKTGRTKSFVLDYAKEFNNRKEKEGLSHIIKNVETRINESLTNKMTPFLLSSIDHVAISDGKIHINELKVIFKLRRVVGLVPKNYKPNISKITSHHTKDPEMLKWINLLVTALHPTAKKVCFDLTCRLLIFPSAQGLSADSQNAWERAFVGAQIDDSDDLRQELYENYCSHVITCAFAIHYYSFKHKVKGSNIGRILEEVGFSSDTRNPEHS